MEVKPVKVQAEIMWAFLDTPNELSGKYQVDLCNLSDSAVDVLKTMGINVRTKDEKIKKLKLQAQFVANIHDEWQIECSEVDADLVGDLAVSSIKEAGKLLKLRCPLDGEYKKGKTWANTH